MDAPAVRIDQRWPRRRPAAADAEPARPAPFRCAIQVPDERPEKVGQRHRWPAISGAKKKLAWILVQRAVKRATVQNVRRVKRCGRPCLRAQHRRQQEQPAQNVRTCQPVQIAGGKQRDGQRASQQEIAFERPMQPEPEPDARLRSPPRRAWPRRPVPRNRCTIPVKMSAPHSQAYQGCARPGEGVGVGAR